MLAAIDIGGDTPAGQRKLHGGITGETIMAKIDFDKIPKFSELPIKKGAPADSNWGVFGDDDEVGCVNFLSPEGIVEAAKLVSRGKVFRLDTPINYANPPLFERQPVDHLKKSFESYGLLGFDDVQIGRASWRERV